jgi:hypothetical protein
MATYQSPLAVVIKGALAGAAATATTTAFVQRAPELLDRIGLATERPPTPPARPSRRRSPTERAVERATSLSPKEAKVAGGVLHWAYGAGWGAYYAVIQSTFRLPSLLHGTWLAGLMAVVAIRAVPMLGLAPAPRTRDQLITNVASHAVFGWTTAIVYALLNFGRRG